jgi:hypothetical protein
MIYISKEPVDEGIPDYTCRAFHFSMTVGGMVFKVRNYQDKPGEFTIINPEARQSPLARQLVDYLVSALGGQRMNFYDEQSESYREVNLQTLEFIGCENGQVQHRPKPATLAIRPSRTCAFMPA